MSEHETDATLVREGLGRQPGCPLENCHACKARQVRIDAGERLIAEVDRLLAVEREQASVDLTEARRRYRTAETALDQARGLLDEWTTVDAAAANTPSRLLKRVHDWLRAGTSSREGGQ